MNRTKIFLIVQSVLCIILVVLLAAAAIGIYRQGLAVKAADPLSPIYTRQKAAAALVPVLPLLAVSLGLTVMGLVLDIRDRNGEKPVKDTASLRDLTVGRAAAESTAMKAERTRQKRLLWTGRAAFALCMVPVLLYLSNANHFPNGDLEPMFLALAGHVIPWIAMGLAALMITSALEEKSMLREIEAAKEQINAEKASGTQPEAKKEGKKAPPRRTRLLRAALLILAAALIIAGAFNGSAKDVFGKAVKICTECVGLG